MKPSDDAGEIRLTVFEHTFKEFGLPHAIRTATACRFASAHALYGLSKLAVWWLDSASRSNGRNPVIRAERPSRAHAPDAEEGRDQARRAKRLAAQARFDAFMSSTTGTGRTKAWG